MNYFKRKIKEKIVRINVARRALAYAIKVGLRYYNDADYRKQIIKNKSSKEKYKSFKGNKNKIKEVLIKRDGAKCKWCNTPLERDEMTIDHLIPIKNGGGNGIKNLRILCEDCHIMKTKAENGELDFMKKENYSDKIKTWHTNHQSI